MNFLELSKLIDDESITKVEFIDDGFIVNFKNVISKKDNVFRVDGYEDLTSAEFKRLTNRSAVQLRKQPNIPHNNYFNYTQVSYDVSLQYKDVIKLSCDINITRNIVNKNKLSFKYKLIINNDITPTEISLYIEKFDRLILSISDINFQGKIETINNINQLISDHDFNFNMVYE